MTPKRLPADKTDRARYTDYNRWWLAALLIPKVFQKHLYKWFWKYWL